MYSTGIVVSSEENQHLLRADLLCAIHYICFTFQIYHLLVCTELLWSLFECSSKASQGLVYLWLCPLINILQFPWRRLSSSTKHIDLKRMHVEWWEKSKNAINPCNKWSKRCHTDPTLFPKRFSYAPVQHRHKSEKHRRKKIFLFNDLFLPMTRFLKLLENIAIGSIQKG